MAASWLREDVRGAAVAGRKGVWLTLYYSQVMNKARAIRLPNVLVTLPSHVSLWMLRSGHSAASPVPKALHASI